jgi:hypothetical protein
MRLTTQLEDMLGCLLIYLLALVAICNCSISFYFVYFFDCHETKEIRSRGTFRILYVQQL